MLMLVASRAHEAQDHEYAIRSLRAALEITPNAGSMYFELGNCLFAPLQSAAEAGDPVDAKRANEAESAFRAAIAADDDQMPPTLQTPIGMAYNNLGNLLTLQQRYEEAETMLRTGLRIQPIAYQYNGLAHVLVQRAEPVGHVFADALPSHDAPTAADHDRAVSMLEEAVELLKMAISHEAVSCPAGPAREEAYKENLAHVTDALQRLQSNMGDAPDMQSRRMASSDEASNHASLVSSGVSRLEWQNYRRLIVMLVPPGAQCDETRSCACDGDNDWCRVVVHHRQASV